MHTIYETRHADRPGLRHVIANLVALKRKPLEFRKWAVTSLTSGVGSDRMELDEVRSIHARYGNPFDLKEHYFDY